MGATGGPDEDGGSRRSWNVSPCWSSPGDAARKSMVSWAAASGPGPAGPSAVVSRVLMKQIRKSDSGREHNPAVNSLLCGEFTPRAWGLASSLSYLLPPGTVWE